jgi:SET domain-containing protein
MLLVKTKLDRSLIEGIGLFADEFIPKGTTVWRRDAVIDIRFSEEDIANLSETAFQQITKYSYRDKESGLYVLCGDDARFFNHSEDPNCLDFGDYTFAHRDIEMGEELTCDYMLFDLDMIEGKYKITQEINHEMHIV